MSAIHRSPYTGPLLAAIHRPSFRFGDVVKYDRPFGSLGRDQRYMVLSLDTDPAGNPAMFVTCLFGDYLTVYTTRENWSLAE